MSNRTVLLQVRFTPTEQATLRQYLEWEQSIMLASMPENLVDADRLRLAGWIMRETSASVFVRRCLAAELDARRVAWLPNGREVERAVRDRMLAWWETQNRANDLEQSRIDEHARLDASGITTPPII